MSPGRNKGRQVSRHTCISHPSPWEDKEFCDFQASSTKNILEQSPEPFGIYTLSECVCKFKKESEKTASHTGQKNMAAEDDEAPSRGVDAGLAGVRPEAYGQRPMASAADCFQ